MVRRLLLLPIGLLLALLLPAVASASGGGSGAPDETFALSGTHALGDQAVLLATERVTAAGQVSSPAPGARVRVTFRRGGRAIKTVNRALDGSGRYSADLAPNSTGVITVEATMPGAGSLGTARVLVLKPTAGPSESGLHVRFLQQQLRALHYAVRETGRMDDQTNSAVIAYRKVNGFQRVTNATRTIFFALAQGRGGYRVRYPGDGRHVEADLTHQVLALVNPGGQVFRLYHMSSGRPSLKTPVGRFRIFSQLWGWNHGAYDGSYFVKSQGYTCGVHGYPWVPTHPGSHCCLRIAMADARFVRLWIHMRMRVDTFYRRTSAAVG